MQQISNNLFVGLGSDCFYHDKENWAIIHACKDPCHKVGVGYSKNLNSTHPNYLVLEKENHLFLNLVDMAVLDQRFTQPIIKSALNFIEAKNKNRSVLIHCNQGLSRSPALALLFLAKRARAIPNENYEEAKRAFIQLYPAYNPGTGIDNYLRIYWNVIQ